MTMIYGLNVAQDRHQKASVTTTEKMAQNDMFGNQICTRPRHHRIIILDASPRVLNGSLIRARVAHS